MKTLKRTWAEVSLDNLEHNYHAIQNHIPAECRFLGVVKADAYGHGAVPIGHALCELGAAYLAVANLEEAVQLRRGGIHAPVLILGYTPAEFAETMVSMDITQEVHSLPYARELNAALSGTKDTLKVHLKLDTGMTRIGFFAYESEQVLPELLEVCRLPHLHAEGVFTHFSVADSRAPDDEAYTRKQYARFVTMLDALDANGVKPELRHCASSGATMLYPEFALDMVRPGIATYGHTPSKDTEGVLDLRPLMTVRTKVAQIREVEAGTAISYGRTYTPEQKIRMAVLPIGYADGLSRGLSGKVTFRIRGKEVRQIGRICMDMCMVDVTELPEIQVGDTATLFGYDTDGTKLPCERLAQSVGTISYEILCGINKRVPRIYMQDGKEQKILQYIV